MIKASHLQWIVVLVVAAAAGVVQAADFPVAAGDVPQLIAAITAANANGVADVINLAGGSYDLTTADNTSVTDGANGLPVVTSAITINGNDAVIRRTGAPPFRIFQVGASGDLTLNAVTVSGGSAPGGSGAGGGILLSDDTNSLTLTDSTITGNSATVFGGGLAMRGTSQTVTLTRTTVSSNTAQAGGGIEVQAVQVTLTLDDSLVTGNTAHSDSSTANGGGISVSGGPHTITLTDSVVDGNTASSDTGGAAEGGGISSSAEVTYTIVGTTISNNHATGGAGVGAGGGINDSGGAIWTMSNSTISGNSASGAVAFLGGGGIESDSSPAAFTLKNVTITNNQARQGGGIDVSAGAVVLENTILANNGGTASSPDCAGPVTSHGHNVIKSRTGCTVVLGAGDITNQDPLLGPLADNGGPTLTHALLAGSPAADAGDPAGCKDGANVLLTTDQRGFVRPFGAACDVGAFERGLVVEPPVDVERPKKIQNDLIVFSSDRTTPANPEGDAEIFVMTAIGTKLQQLTVNSGLADREPAWSPFGRKIAFSRLADGTDNSDIFTMNPDGTLLRRLTSSIEPDHDPSWAPNARRIAWVRRVIKGASSDTDILAMDVDGAHKVNLTDPLGVGNEDEESPTWGVDSRRLAFVRHLGGVNPDIFIMDADGTNQVNVTNTPAGTEEIEPAWAPNGKKIAFARRDGTSFPFYEIWTINPDGTGLTQITSSFEGGGRVDASLPAWAPDSRWLVYNKSVSPPDGLQTEIVTIKADGSAPATLESNPALDDSPDWALR